ncbi:MAG: nuclear transport factor 2 family protein [Gemmatimonadaceae bacterium]
MRSRILIFAALFSLATVVTSARLMPNAADEAEVRAALQHYLLGHATGDGAHFRVVFHPDSKLYFNRDGKFSMRTSEDYIAGAAGKPAADEDKRKRRIVSVDVTGDAAMAKVELDYPNAVLTDYFTLLKIDGKWMIMNKIFNTSPKR